MCATLSMLQLRGRRTPLLRWVLDELDALGDVAAQTLVASLKQLLLVVISRGDDIERLLRAIWLSHVLACLLPITA